LIKKKVRIGFIGAGSVGSLFGGLISMRQSKKYSVEVILFGRKNHIECINKHGLTIQTDQKRNHVNNLQAFDRPEVIEDTIQKNPDFSFDFVFLTTKACDTRSALVQYKNIINASKWIVILQNGIGNEEIVKEYYSGDKIIRGVTTFGALVRESGLVTLTGLGVTHLGFIETKTQYLNNDEFK
jgi:2-dehydropantoate 2-reductase